MHSKLYMQLHFFSTKEKAISKQQQNSTTNNEPLQTGSTNNELLPSVEHHVISHDAVAADITNISGISYRQLLQQEDDYDRALENEAPNHECEVSKTETEDNEKLLDAKQGMTKRTINACLSTLTATMAILR